MHLRCAATTACVLHGSQLTAHSSQLTAHSSQLTAHSSLLAAHCSQLTAGDQTAPWGTKWIGKGAKSTGWFHNIPIVYYKSIKVTFQMNPSDSGKATLWKILRGAEGLPLQLGDLRVPLEGGSVRLSLQVKTDVHLAPLDFYDLALVPKGKKGSIFMTALFVNSSKNYNFMEGCFHLYQADQSWPGMLLSTGKINE